MALTAEAVMLHTVAFYPALPCTAMPVGVEGGFAEVTGEVRLHDASLIRMSTASSWHVSWKGCP